MASIYRAISGIICLAGLTGLAACAHKQEAVNTTPPPAPTPPP